MQIDGTLAMLIIKLFFNLGTIEVPSECNPGTAGGTGRNVDGRRMVRGCYADGTRMVRGWYADGTRMNAGGTRMNADGTQMGLRLIRGATCTGNVPCSCILTLFS